MTITSKLPSIELTTQESAELLNMSKSTVTKLIESQDIVATRSEDGWKITFFDLMEYKNSLNKNRVSTLNELSELDQQMGMGY